jgi:hypothetical protein
MNNEKVIKWADTLIDDYVQSESANIAEYQSEPDESWKKLDLKERKLREEIRKLLNEKEAD